MRQGDLLAAHACYDAAIGVDASSPHAFKNRGYLHLKMSAYEKAIADLTQAAALSAEPDKVTCCDKASVTV